jgi:hypothetical protein
LHPSEHSERSINPLRTMHLRPGTIESTMKIFAVIIALALFLASFPLFAYAFWVPEQWAALTFFAGIMTVTMSLAIPFHLLGRRD